MCVYEIRFLFATKQFSLLFLFTFRLYIHSLCVLCRLVHLCVCRFVVLSFVQCTLQISIFSIRFTSNVLNVKIFSSNFITPLILLRCFLIFLVVLEPQYIQLLLPIRHINSMSYSVLVVAVTKIDNNLLILFRHILI